jgi:NDP-sugar pyrophosphorylase family protein
MTGARAGEQAHCLDEVDAFVLAGGLGTRIRAVLGDTPKLLAPVGGRPYLAFLLDWLRRFGVRRVVLGLGHRADAVVAYLRADPVPDMSIATVIEPQPLGTAGAIRFGRPALRTDPVLVVNGDSFVDADLCGLLACHRAAGALATVVCAEVDDARRYGRVAVDRGGRIEAFVEKDPAFSRGGAVNAGVYLMSAALLDAIAAGDAVSLEHDVFARLPSGSLAAFSGPFGFIDIGTPDSLARAAGVLVGCAGDRP